MFPRVRRSVARRSTGASRLVEYVRDVKIELQREETEPDVIDAGYFAKQIVPRPEWLQAPLVREICSASNCVSHAPDDWVHRWLHNEFGWFNRVTDAVAVIPPDQRGTYRLFAYRMFPAVFRGGNRRTILVPSDVHADPIPPTFLSLGLTASTSSWSQSWALNVRRFRATPWRRRIMTNQYCLFGSLDEAISGATRFSIEQPEPGDYYVVEVLEDRRTVASRAATRAAAR